MAKKPFIRADEIAAELDVSKSTAYKIIKNLNSELRRDGYLTVSGRVNRAYFMKKLGYQEPTTEREDHGSL